jgi:hypothetical protein
MAGESRSSSAWTTELKKTSKSETNAHGMKSLLAEIAAQEDEIRQGGGKKAAEAQRAKGRLTVRERLDLLLDKDTPFLEVGLWAAQGMYAEYGGAPSAGVVTGIGRVHGRLCMIIANDATVKAGSFFPMTAKKVLRAQAIALENRIPTLYLVDSSGVFLPLQEEVFPDQDDFGRVFRNNAVMSSLGIPQMTAIMGMCVAGGAYLPVMTDTVLMTEGSGLSSRLQSGRRPRQKSWAARRCTLRSPAPWTSRSRMITFAWQGSAPWWRRWAIGKGLPSLSFHTTPLPTHPNIPPATSIRCSIHRPLPAMSTRCVR